MRDGSFYFSIAVAEPYKLILDNFSEAVYAKDSVEFDRAKSAALMRLDEITKRVATVTREQFVAMYSIPSTEQKVD